MNCPGVPRMHERPIGDLVDALRALGSDIRYAASEGYPPLSIGARGDARDRHGCDSRRRVEPVPDRAADGAAARRRRGTTIEVIGELISKPYVEITLELMRRFGVEVERDAWQRFLVPGGARYASPGTIAVEGDASSASYFLAAGAIGGGPVRVIGVGARSIQGDVALRRRTGAMGAVVDRGEDWIEVRRADP